MIQIPTFKKEQDIRLWANTSLSKRVENNLLQVKHFQDGLYYYFEYVNGIWSCIMNSIQDYYKE